MILADCISGHFGGLHYARQAKPTGKRIRRHMPENGLPRGPDQRHGGRTSRRLCGCGEPAIAYSKTCIQCDRGVK